MSHQEEKLMEASEGLTPTQISHVTPAPSSMSVTLYPMIMLKTPTLDESLNWIYNQEKLKIIFKTLSK